MITELDYMNQIELDYVTGKLELTEMQAILNGETPTSKKGKITKELIDRGLVSMYTFKGFVIHVEECLTARVGG